MEFSPLYTSFEIPDPARPIDPADRGECGPSGELVPFLPPPLDAAGLAGRRIAALSCILGTYGMGGPGFFELDLGGDWLVIAISGAGDWIHVDGRLVTDMFHADRRRPAPWIDGARDELSPVLTGAEITSLTLGRDWLRLTTHRGTLLEIAQAPETRPRYEGSKQLRRLLPQDDLRRAVFLSPTPELWI
ncbi:MAG: hypothetical protein AAFR46_03530 [Pseudomonadota bacterium]